MVKRREKQLPINNIRRIKVLIDVTFNDNLIKNSSSQ